MAPTTASKPCAQHPNQSTSSGITKTSRTRRVSKTARLALETALAMAERNRTESPLLRLPGEIRNKIYHCLIEDDLLPFSCNFARGGSCGDFKDQWILGQAWVERYTLTGICRDIRTEFGSVMTSFDTMRFNLPRDFYKWSRVVFEGAKVGIRTVRLSYVGYSDRTLRRYLTSLRTLADLREVIVEKNYFMYSEGQEEIVALKAIAGRQGGRWEVVIEE